MFLYIYTGYVGYMWVYVVSVSIFVFEPGLRLGGVEGSATTSRPNSTPSTGDDTLTKPGHAVGARGGLPFVDIRETLGLWCFGLDILGMIEFALNSGQKDLATFEGEYARLGCVSGMAGLFAGFFGAGFAGGLGSCLLAVFCNVSAIRCLNRGWRGCGDGAERYFCLGDCPPTAPTRWPPHRGTRASRADP